MDTNKRPGTTLLVGKLATMLGQGLTLLVLGRLDGPSAVGLYTLGLALVTPAFLLGHMRLQDVVATRPRLYEYWVSYRRLASFVPAIFLIAAVIVASIIGDQTLVSVVGALAVLKVVESRVFVVHGYWQNIGRFNRIMVSSAVRAFVGVLVLVAALQVWGFEIGLWLVSASALLLTPLLERVHPDRGAAHEAARIQPKMIRHLLPLGLAAMLLSANQSVIRVVVDWHVGLVELGIFAVSAYAVRLGSLIGQAAGQAQAPGIRLARETGQREVIFRLGIRAGTAAAAGGAVLIFLGVIGGPEVLALVFGDEFKPTRTLLGVILCAGVPLYYSTALATASVAVERGFWYISSVSVGLLITTAAVLALTPYFGLVGASIGWLMGELAKAAALTVHLWHGSRSERTNV